MDSDIILKPQFGYDFIGVQGSQRVKYLKVPKNVTRRGLQKSIRKGALQFKEIDALLDKGSEASNYVVITADNYENAYMAIAYHTTCRIEQERGDAVTMGESFDDDDDDTEEIDWEAYDYDKDMEYIREEEWLEGNEDYEWPHDDYMVPIITADDISNIADNQSHTDIIFNNSMMQGNNAVINPKPYWMDIDFGSICILMKDDDSFPFKTFTVNDEIIALLERFSSCRNIYIVYLKKNMERDDFIYKDEDPFGSTIGMPDGEKGVSPEEVERLRIVLSCVAEETEIATKDAEKYIRFLLKENFNACAMKFKSRFPFNRLIKSIRRLNEDKVADMVDKIVRYAKKRKKGVGAYGIEDFSFMERFIVTAKNKPAGKYDARKRLAEELVGLCDIKKEVEDVVNVMKFHKIREQMDISGGSYHNVHLMLGAPGTAKTTVAKLMGQIMMEEGLLPNNRFICVNGAELKGMYVGHSAPKTHRIFNENDIIVIDEAYSLVENSGRMDSFSNEAIAQMIIEMEAHSTDKLIIFAGYGGAGVSEENDRMKAFIDSNPGIKSRITHTFLFPTYSPEDMVEIFYRQAKTMNYIVSAEAKESLMAHFKKRVTDRNFGNGREARSLLETAVVYAAGRIFKNKKKSYTEAELKSVAKEDVIAAIGQTEKTEAGRMHRKNSFGFTM